MTDVWTHLMFQDGSAREAVARYVELIPGSTITDVTGPDGPGQVIRFTLANRPFIAFDSPTAHEFGFTPSMSIFVTCDTPDEVGVQAGADVRGRWIGRVGDLRLALALRQQAQPVAVDARVEAAAVA